MSNDNKTLADAQPGGRVRLGDQAELDRLEFQAWARWFVAPVERDEAGDYVSDFTRGLWCAWQAALAAQPSPGGQAAHCPVKHCGMTYARVPADGRCHACGATVQPSLGGQGDALAEHITDHLCSNDYDIGGRPELLACVAQAIASTELSNYAAEAWAKGYAQGIADERTSEANIGIAGFNCKVEPARENPYLAARQPVGATDQQYNSGGIELTACQLHEALLMAGSPELDVPFEDRSLVRIFWTETGHSGRGLYCECVGAEEEGCILLDGSAPAIGQSAHAVDLGQFRTQVAELLRREFDLEVADPEDQRHDDGSGEADRIAGKIAALIDSQAVGK